MNRTDPIFRVVNRFCILCLIGSRVGSGNGRVGSGFSFCSPLLTVSNNITRLGRRFIIETIFNALTLLFQMVIIFQTND
ncbi:hypothetical protein Hanom_Chr01g00060581 [Helianthus anomalus]